MSHFIRLSASVSMTISKSETSDNKFDFFLWKRTSLRGPFDRVISAGCGYATPELANLAGRDEYKFIRENS